MAYMIQLGIERPGPITSTEDTEPRAVAQYEAWVRRVRTVGDLYESLPVFLLRDGIVICARMDAP